jgi:formylglycine-generating enzyme required for sulfatase activity
MRIVAIILAVLAAAITALWIAGGPGNVRTYIANRLHLGVGCERLASSSTQPLSACQESALKSGDAFRECQDCPAMVVVPAGSFTMGSPEGSADRYDDEGPQRLVNIAKRFAVSKFVVTFDQFAAFVSDTHYDAGSQCWTFEGGKGEVRLRSWRSPGFSTSGTQPVVCMNWYDAKAYVAWIARKTGHAYRLPTEAEWEYAARGRTEPVPYTRWFFGDDENDLCRYGNVMDHTARTSIEANQEWPFAKCSDGFAHASPVGSFEPNGFGLYDMVGNAWQFTEDCYHDSYNGAPSDGSAWTTGDCSRRTDRGGGWSVFPKNLRTSMRGKGSPEDRFTSTGIRVARTLE